MRLRDREEPMDPEVTRDLDALDRALAGRELESDQAGWAEVVALLGEERPEPAPGWSEELDRRMAGGFAEPGTAGAGFAERLRRVRPFRVAAPIGGVAALAVVVAIGLSSSEQGADDFATSMPEPVGPSTSEVQSAAQAPTDDAAAAGSLASPPAVRDGGVAPGTADRKVERDVAMTLSTRPDDFRSTTDEAIAITRSLGGIVLSSQISEQGRQATASLQLTIPTRNLDAAVDRLTALANVESLNEASTDITGAFVSAEDRLEDAEATREELLDALGNAETAAEADAIQRQIDQVRRQIARAEASFDEIARRARLSDLALTIQSDPEADARDDDEGRSFGDWLDDTVSVLRDLAGVLLISAAILVPTAILAALAWLVVRTLRRRGRERALD